MIIKRFWLALLALVVLAGCGGVQQGGINAFSPTPNPADAVATITYRNGTVEYISENELNATAQRLASLSNQPTPPPPEFTMNWLLSRKLMLHLARTTDTIASPQEIDQIVSSVTDQQGFCNQIVARTGGDTRTFLDQCVQALGFDDGTAFRNFLAEELTIERVAEQQAPQDLIRTAHILTETYEEAAQIYDRLQQFPDQFTQLARERSIDPGSRANGGELPAFNQEGFTDAPQGQQPQQFNATFVDTAWQLRDQFEQTGDAISQPFETDFGWHIVRILGLESSQQSAGQFRSALLERALNAQPGDLTGDADTGDVPLIAAIEIRDGFLTPEPVATPDVLPELPSPSPEAVPEPLEEGAEPPAQPEGTPDPAEAPPVEGTTDPVEGAPAEETTEPAATPTK